jgi:hypothetical protein
MTGRTSNVSFSIVRTPMTPITSSHSLVYQDTQKTSSKKTKDRQQTTTDNNKPNVKQQTKRQQIKSSCSYTNKTNV